MEEIDGMALRIGRLLREAKQAAPQDFDRWVVNDLPFGLETARRLIAISAAYEKLPSATLASLPRPWQALYALKGLPADAIEEGISAGEISPTMTVNEAIQYRRKFSTPAERRGRVPHTSPADDIAGTLMRHHAIDLHPTVLNALTEWVAVGVAATGGKTATPPAPDGEHPVISL